LYTKFWSESLKGGDNAEDLVIDGKIVLEWILKSSVDRCIWLRIGTSGGLM
jgi:hypothetical protein